MDPWKKAANDFSQPVTPPTSLQNSAHESRQKPEVEVKDPFAARKVQKADREKLRRDRLNQQFQELGNALDPDRPKNDKATILTDTIQTLKDLTAEVNRLKAEYTTLSEESREVTQEKNELREEKASLKSDIESLKIQYQQRCRIMFPWAAVDHSLVMTSPYSYTVPVPVPPGTIPMHPSMQPFPIFGNQNPGTMPGPCSTFIPYRTPANPLNDQPSAQYASTSHVSSRQDSKSKLTDNEKCSNIRRCEDSNDVATDLELKIPGSSERKGKQSRSKERNVTTVSSSSRFSSSQGLQDSSSNSVGDVPKTNS
ncbi:hypothetical protein K2173_006084 [Erythroxylum novogranatense]|uniref:BHLH domain-containing protein n=1 Tax=Erythroxylum novogranatense TaxID=1862640 RepID=A0AAV8TDR9_9ROSI|nr:hypothetical protein K2173_006084 [Erythroxylum novogranatense]